jgi:ribosomal protein L35
VTEQRIADQKRLIVNKKLIPDEKFTEIKNEVAHELQNISTDTQEQNNFANSNPQIPVLTHSVLNQPLESKNKMKWSNTLNESLMQCYFEVTELESNMTIYRRKLHSKFIEKHPYLSHLSEQRLADQRRSIVKNKLISQHRLEHLKTIVNNSSDESLPNALPAELPHYQLESQNRQNADLLVSNQESFSLNNNISCFSVLRKTG